MTELSEAPQEQRRAVPAPGMARSGPGDRGQPVSLPAAPATLTAAAAPATLTAAPARPP